MVEKGKRSSDKNCGQLGSGDMERTSSAVFATHILTSPYTFLSGRAEMEGEGEARDNGEMDGGD